MPLPSQVLLLLIVVIAAFTDWRTRRIPNWLTLSGLLAAFALNGALMGTAGLRAAGAGALLAFLVYMPLYLLRGMGAGDVKLMVALGAAVGPTQWFLLFLVTAIAAGAAAAVLVLRKRRAFETMHNIAQIIYRLGRMETPTIDTERALRMPHALSIAIGTLGSLLLQHL